MHPVGTLYHIRDTSRSIDPAERDALGTADASWCLARRKIGHVVHYCVLTSAHVVADTEETVLVDDLRMETQARVERRALIFADDKKTRDLAVLVPARVPSILALNLADSMPEQGSMITWWGTDDRWRPESAQVQLLLAGIPGSDTDGFGCFSAPAGLRDGDSGGPILDSNGRLIGITQGTKKMDQYGRVGVFCPLWMIQEVIGGVS